MGHGVGVVHHVEDVDKKVCHDGAECHVDHRQRDREGPVVKIPVHDVLVVQDHQAAQEEPDCHVGE